MARKDLNETMFSFEKKKRGQVSQNDWPRKNAI
jgi:hypothetical protein